MTWILVAHRTGAALFEHTTPTGLRRLDRVPGVREPTPTKVGLASPAARKDEVEMLRYTLRLAELLETGVRGAGVDALILMAEARMLGSIRRHLSSDTKRHIHASLNIAVPDWDEASLVERLAPLLAEKRSAVGSADFF